MDAIRPRAELVRARGAEFRSVATSRRTPKLGSPCAWREMRPKQWPQGAYDQASLFS